MKQSYSCTCACLHINTLLHVQIYKSTDILTRFPILIPYTPNVFSTQPPAPSRNGGGLLSVTVLHIVPVTPLQAAWKVTALQTVGWQLDVKRGADWCWWQMQKGIYCWPPEPFLNFFLFLWLDQLLSFLVTEGPHHASGFPQGGPSDVRHVVHLSIAQLARQCPCSPRFAAY